MSASDRHYYADCTDPDCMRYGCRAYRDGYNDGYLDGFADGAMTSQQEA